MLESHRRVVMLFNHLAMRDIPYRSAAIADFAIGTVLDDTKRKMFEVEEREQANMQ